MRSICKETRNDKFVQPFLSSRVVSVIDDVIAKSNRRLKQEKILEIEIRKTHFGVGIGVLQNGERIIYTEYNSLKGSPDDIFQETIDRLITDVLAMLLLFDFSKDLINGNTLI